MTKKNNTLLVHFDFVMDANTYKKFEKICNDGFLTPLEYVVAHILETVEEHEFLNQNCIEVRF